jgi:hypothetical protein
MADTQVTITQPVIEINFPASGTGPTGPPGPVGGSVITWPAGENLSTGRVVIIDGGEAFYFQPSDTTHQGRAYGITVTSATEGNDVDVQVGGEVQDAAFTFAADTPLWVDDDGEIINTQPALTLIQKAGVASAAQKILIDFSINVKKS